MHLVTDGRGTPLAATLTPGQRHESTEFERVLEAAGVKGRRSRHWPRRVVGDRGYSFPRIRRWLEARRIEAVIPLRENERAYGTGRFDRRAYRKRNVIERCVGWLKHPRRITTRFEKLAMTFLGMLQLAIVSRYLRTAFPNRT